MERIEDICTEYIKQNVQVYGKEVPLNIAETIRGVRKIFEEKYPSPVRVVSVGADLDDILADVTNEKWLKYSIEFCGGTHVAKTGDIKDLVILTEESIAKGIRRVFAITGSDAEEACRLANDFEAKLGKVERMTFSQEKMGKAAKLKGENEKDLKGLIPAVRRSKFATRIKAIEAEGAKLAKEKAKADEKTVVTSVSDYFKKDNPGMVALLDVTPDLKQLSNATAAAIKKGKVTKPVYLFAADNTRVVHCCVVPQVISLETMADVQALVATVDPQGWMDSVVAVLGGGGGGKGNTRSGNSADVSNVKLAVDVARKYLEQCLSN